MDELWIVTGGKEVYYPRVTDFNHEHLVRRHQQAVLPVERQNGDGDSPHTGW
jgi:hypothetical protein